MPHCSSGGPTVLLVRERPSSATHSRSVQPHHLASFLWDSGGRGSEGTAPSISYYLGVVLAGRAGTKGAATSASPLGATSPQAVPVPPGAEDPDTPRAKRPRSLTVPAPLGIRLDEFSRVSPSEDPGEASPAALPRLRRLSCSNVRSGSRAPGQSIRRLPSKARPGLRAGPFLGLHGTPDLWIQAGRLREAPRQPPPFRMGFKEVLFSGWFRTDDGGVQSTLRVRPPS
ncbi:hypothetical protein NDU88_001219 [Pleurodeles waltl]|uniref:Uncharacterized protein n=1 Tax=Pleurodeles waltl TaxID=8319 RepID=A0AAV7S7F3_PLEWA|nr:hypothetical protein NDU88_001219 [Pleurodeles waltl]